jgi:hypothetical protein
MDRSPAPSPRPAPGRRPGVRGFGLREIWVGCGLLALGGCAVQPPAPPLNTAALAEQAYASNATIRSVSDALDRRLDQMLPVRTAELTP